MLDDAHILSASNYARIMFREDLLIIKTPLEVMEFYYLFDSTNIPSLLETVINPRKETYLIGEKEYLSLYVGYDEARLMHQDIKLSKLYDTLDDDFGSPVIVAGFPRKTFTSLDMMHFVPKKFRENYLKSEKK